MGKAEETKINDKEKVINEVEQLKKMDNDDAVAVVKGYHQMLEKCLYNCMNDIRRITDLSPATMRLTKTAVVIAERDFLSDANDDGSERLCMLGGQKELKELFKAIFKNCPDVFEELVKDAGYVKA